MNDAQTIFKIPSRWNYRHLLLAYVVGILFQAIVLPCLCPENDIKASIALWFDGFVLVRILLAYALKETGRGWIFYAFLCYTSAGWIKGIMFLARGRLQG